jgi:hypothetical protein
LIRKRPLIRRYDQRPLLFLGDSIVNEQITKRLTEIALRNVVPALHAATLLEISGDRLFDHGHWEWENHVNEEVRALWGGLDLGQKLIAYIAASEWLEMGGDW